MSSKGLLIVFSGPSGVGKGTVLKQYLAAHPDTHYSISATTRAPRPGEEHGREYYFLSREQFQELIAQDGLLEYAEYSGNYYGTPKAPVEEALSQGRNVILEIEVQGAKKVLRENPQAVSLFIMPPSMKELTRRLVDRKTEDEATVRRRLDTARNEISQAGIYDYIVVNDTLEQAVADMDSVLHAAGFSGKNADKLIEEVLKNA